MSTYSYIDFGSRISALRSVGAALSISTNLIPDQSASNSQRTYLKWINNYRVAKALAPLTNLDYNGFVSALNALMTTTIRSTSPLHFSPNGNFDGSNNFLPASAGFNLADVASPSLLPVLPAGVQALAYLGYTAGNDATFRALVATFTGATGANKIWGWYLIDNVADGLQANLAAESDYLHSLNPSLPVFLEQQNLGPNAGPFVFPNNPANTHADYFGIAPYPVQTNVPNNLDYTIIPRSVTAAVAQGIPLNKIIPIYQAFGGGVTQYPTYILPTATQEWTILQTWQTAMVGAVPPFDYAYAWGQQGDDKPLSTATALLSVFTSYNSHSGV